MNPLEQMSDEHLRDYTIGNYEFCEKVSFGATEFFRRLTEARTDLFAARDALLTEGTARVRAEKQLDINSRIGMGYARETISLRTQLADTQRGLDRIIQEFRDAVTERDEFARKVAARAIEQDRQEMTYGGDKNLDQCVEIALAAVKKEETDADCCH